MVAVVADPFADDVADAQVAHLGMTPMGGLLVVVVTEQVGVDASYDFILEPGHYVLRARFPPPAITAPSVSMIEPWVSVTVHTGQTTHIDIPNMCK